MAGSGWFPAGSPAPLTLVGSAGADVMQRRIVAQGLRDPSAPTPGQLVERLVAVQAQEFAYALWGVSERVAGYPDRPAMLAAFKEGELLRTHLLRPTWHFAVPRDVRWLLRLTAPRLRRQMASQDRRHGIDDDVVARSNAALAAAVRGGRHRTRRELAAILEDAGVPAGEGRIGFLLMHAEFDEVLISGAMNGKQQTYAAFDERVLPGHEFDEEQALTVLARRYMATRGPVTAKDLAAWAGLTLGQARRGLAANENDCLVRDVDGMTLWSLRDAAPARVSRGTVVDLLQGYDELIMSYSESRVLLAAKGVLPVADYATHAHALLLDSALAGHWRHQITGAGAVVEIQLRRLVSAAERAAIAAAVNRYGSYLGMPTTMAEPVLL